MTLEGELAAHYILVTTLEISGGGERSSSQVVAVAQTGNKVHLNSDGESIVGALSRPVFSFSGCTPRLDDHAMLSRSLIDIMLPRLLFNGLTASSDTFACS